MLTKNSVNLPELPRIASMREIQRNYRQLFDWVEKTKKPIFLGSNFEFKIVVLSLDSYNDLISKETQELKPWYKHEPSKAELKKTIQRIRRLAKYGRQDVNLTEFVIKDRESH